MDFRDVKAILAFRVKIPVLSIIKDDQSFTLKTARDRPNSPTTLAKVLLEFLVFPDQFGGSHPQLRGAATHFQ
jgi:hypothetical protein